MKRPDRPTEAEYYEARANIAIHYAPDTYACKKCGWPVFSGYCCSFCGDTNPSEKEDV